MHTLHDPRISSCGRDYYGKGNGWNFDLYHRANTDIVTAGERMPQAAMQFILSTVLKRGPDEKPRGDERRFLTCLDSQGGVLEPEGDERIEGGTEVRRTSYLVHSCLFTT
jgi:hypothetical protein